MHLKVQCSSPSQIIEITCGKRGIIGKSQTQNFQTTCSSSSDGMQMYIPDIRSNMKKKNVTATTRDFSVFCWRYHVVDAETFNS